MQWVEQEISRAYQKPTLHKLTLKQASQALAGRAKDFLESFFPDRRPLPAEEEVLKQYQKPTLKKLTPEQARMLLIGHTCVGDKGARDLMEVVFPDPEHFGQ